ncbi:Serine decarboxylase 1 [Zea mays]|uniref:Serine decarboxylase 1 n=1 Tax=Zea mays TaxID=4577 RepID=A0A3L6FDR3_MAIZE|nr:Serine decarboxylase 1 [Zea mays]
MDVEWWIKETDDVLLDPAQQNGQQYRPVGSNDDVVIQMTSMETRSSSVIIDVVMTSSRQEHLLQGLKRVSWEKVDVSFHNSKVRSATHSVIQPWSLETDLDQDTSFANCGLSHQPGEHVYGNPRGSASGGERDDPDPHHRVRGVQRERECVTVSQSNMGDRAGFHGVPVEERLHWRSFLVKLESKNLKGSKNEELHVASHKREVFPDGILFASRESHYSVFKATRMYIMDCVKVDTLMSGEIDCAMSREIDCDNFQRKLLQNGDKPTIINVNIAKTGYTIWFIACKAHHNMAITEFVLDGCPDSNRLLKILGDFKAVLASAFAKNDSKKVVAATSCVLQLSIVLGMCLTVVLGLAMRFGVGIFTSDVPMIQVIHRGIPFVAGTQTINSLAFVFDGINFGASDYRYSAYSMFSHRFQTLAQIRLQKQSKQLAEWNTAAFSSEFTATKHKEDFVHVWHPHNQNVGATGSGLSGVATVSSTLGVLRAYSPNSTSASSSNLSTVHMGGLTCITQPTTELGSEDTIIAQFLSNPAQVGPSESPVLFSGTVGAASTFSPLASNDLPVSVTTVSTNEISAMVPPPSTSADRLGSILPEPLNTGDALERYKQVAQKFLLYLVNCVVLRTHCSSFCIKCSSDEELLLSLS